MAGVKISALPAIPSSQLTDIFPAVQASTTFKTTLSQLLTLFNSNIQLASITQVTGLTAALASFLPLTGGTMSGLIDMGNNKITNLTDPTNPQDAATKSYVDLTASGFTVILATQAATTGNLNATQAGAGVGATLTNAGAMAAFAVDGYSANLNDRILVKNQTLSQHNGVYTVTTVGSGAVNWVLTRATDYDQAPSEIKPGTLVAVNNGTVNATTSWLETATVTIVDTDPILFSQFTFAPSAFFQIANNLSEGVPATMRTNLGLGTVATKTASDNTKTFACMLSAAPTIGNVAVFADANGTLIDGGVTGGTVTSVSTSGLATGGPITTTGTVTVPAAVKSDQITASSTSVAVVPGVQQFHPSAAKAWCKVNQAAGVYTLSDAYNVSSILKNSSGNVTVNFSNNFTDTNYVAVANIIQGVNGIIRCQNPAIGSIQVQMITTNGTSSNLDASFCLVAYGTI